MNYNQKIKYNVRFVCVDELRLIDLDYLKERKVVLISDEKITPFDFIDAKSGNIRTKISNYLDKIDREDYPILLFGNIKNKVKLMLDYELLASCPSINATLINVV